MATSAPTGRFSALLLEGLDHYRKGRMREAVRAWEEAYLLEPTNLRAREFLRSALERIHAHMTPGQTEAGAAAAGEPAPAQKASHPWLPQSPPIGPPAAQPQPPRAPAARTAAQVPASEQKTAISQTAPAARKSPAAGGAPAARKSPSTGGAPAAPKPAAAPGSPWDDGPSVAIHHEEDSGDGAAGAWSIHQEALPIEAGADDETEIWFKGARELVALNDFSGALELLGKILARKPSDKEALQLHESCEQNLTLMFESKIGAMAGRPQVAIPPDEVIWLNLDPRAGFVLAQIDGEVSFEDLYAICGLKRLDTARILCQLLEEGVVQVQGQDRAVAKRAMNRT